MTDEQLTAFASAAGKVEAVSFALRRRHAYVTYSSAAEATAAIAKLHDNELDGRKVNVQASLPPKERKAAVTEDASAEPRGTTTNSVVVRGLNREVKSEALKAAFDGVGAVSKARMDRTLGRVRFENDESVEKALALTGTQIEGCTITVERELVKAKKPAAEKPAAPAKAKKVAAAAAPAAEKAAAASPRSSREVRVDGITATTTADELKAHFASVGGRITGAKVVRGEHAYVSFDAAEDATKAVTLDGTTLNGATLKVSQRPARAAKKAAATAEPGAGKKRTADEADEEEEEDATPAVAPVNTVWVGNLPVSATSEEVQAAFAAYGEVTVANIRRRFGYVTFANEAAFNAAVAAGASEAGVTMGDEKLKVEAASAPKPRKAKKKAAAAPAAPVAAEKATEGKKTSRRRRRNNRAGAKSEEATPATA